MGELRHGTLHTTQKLNVDFFQPVYNTVKAPIDVTGYWIKRQVLNVARPVSVKFIS
jgi:hypothetical protein